MSNDNTPAQPVLKLNVTLQEALVMHQALMTAPLARTATEPALKALVTEINKVTQPPAPSRRARRASKVPANK